LHVVIVVVLLFVVGEVGVVHLLRVRLQILRGVSFYGVVVGGISVWIVFDGIIFIHG
jgi:hypothetical protein